MTEETGAPAPKRAALICGLLSVGWLVGTLWSAQRSIAVTNGEVATAVAAVSLPSAVSAGLVAGLGVGLIALVTLHRFAVAGRRFAVAIGAGLFTGIASALVIVLVSDGSVSQQVVAAALAAATTLGGGLAAVSHRRVVCAQIAATLAVFAAAAGLSLLQGPLLAEFGGDGDLGARTEAIMWFSIGTAVLCGLAAGLVGLAMLGRKRGPWLPYLLAGAAPGLLLLASEAMVRFGGVQLLDRARSISPADRVLQDWLDGTRLNHALVVLFLGAITAMIGYGRALGSPPDQVVSRTPVGKQATKEQNAPATVDAAGSAPTSAG